MARAALLMQLLRVYRDRDSSSKVARAVVTRRARSLTLRPPSSCTIRAFDQLGIAVRWEEG